MEFALSEEQEILMDSVKKMLDENIASIIFVNTLKAIIH